MRQSTLPGINIAHACENPDAQFIAACKQTGAADGLV
jgi:hypothetical protein